MLSVLKARKDEIRIQRIIDKFEPELRRKFLEQMQLIKDQIDLEELADQLEAGNTNAAFKIIDDGIKAFAQNLDIVFIEGAVETATQLNQGLRINVSFDRVNVDAVDQIRSNKLALIREFSAEQRRVVNSAMQDAIERGLNPLEQARHFRNTVGLTEYQERIIRNYRRQLEELDRRLLDRLLRDRRFDRTVEAAIRGGKPLSRSQIDKMVQRYRERWIKHRAEMIARTEALHSANAGSHQMIKQAVDSGDVNPNDLVDTWLTSKDEKVRDSHSVMNGQTIVWGQTFTTGNGNHPRYPGDFLLPADDRIHCRCTHAIRFRSL